MSRAWNVSERIAVAQRRPTNARRQASGWLDGEVYAVQSARLKYIHRSESEGELYDLVADPLELRPLELGEEGRDLRAYLGRILQRHEGREAVQEQKVSDEILEELRALGYMGADE